MAGSTEQYTTRLPREFGIRDPLRNGIGFLILLCVSLQTTDLPWLGISNTTFPTLTQQGQAGSA